MSKVYMGKEVLWNENKAGYLNMTPGFPYFTLFLLYRMGWAESAQANLLRHLVSQRKPFLLFFKVFYLLLREREHKPGRGRERQKIQSRYPLTAVSPTRGSNEQTVRSWPKLKLVSTSWATQVPLKEAIFNSNPIFTPSCLPVLFWFPNPLYSSPTVEW